MISSLWYLFGAFHLSVALTIRPATPADVWEARKSLLASAMNPLSVTTDYLLAAGDDDGRLVGFGQIRPLDDRYCELASLYVKSDCRKQGTGSRLVEELLKRHDETDFRTVCLLTLRPTTNFYERFGFATIDNLTDLPSSIRFEYAAGAAVSRVLGNDIVCMVRRQSRETGQG